MAVTIKGYIKVPFEELEIIKTCLSEHIENTLNEDGCLKFEVFAHIEGNNITAHYSDGEKLEDPRLVYDEKLGWKLFFTEWDHVNECEQETFEFVDEIEESNKEKFERAASSNKENKTSFKF